VSIETRWRRNCGKTDRIHRKGKEDRSIKGKIITTILKQVISDHDEAAETSS